VNPRALAAWSAAGLLIALGTGNPAYRLLIAAIALAVLVATARRGAPIRPLVLALGALIVVSGLFNVVLAHLGTHVVGEIPDWVPGVGGPLTVEAFAGGAAAGLGLAAAVLTVAPLTLSQDPQELVDALPAVLNRTGSALAASFNLVPGIARSFTAVREAQLLRGWRPRGPRSWGEIVVPVVLTAIEDSIQLAESMEARGFGAGPRTGYTTRRWSKHDVAVACGAAVALAVFVMGRLTGVAVDWEPYPSLQPPDLNAVVAAATLLLLLPLARR
jgi:energy-coupling factor transport system permease protein